MTRVPKAEQRRRKTERERERRATDPEFAAKKRARSLAYYYANREIVKAKRRAERAANPELAREKARVQRKRNAAAIRTRQKRYAARNPEKIKALAARKRLRKYGLTVESYNALIDRQLGRCAICHAEIAQIDPALIHVDHCHNTSRVRGVLCVCCNSLLGFAKESTATLQRAITYLEGNQ